jgi:hypothetical protein
MAAAGNQGSAAWMMADTRRKAAMQHCFVMQTAACGNLSACRQEDGLLAIAAASVGCCHAVYHPLSLLLLMMLPHPPPHRLPFAAANAYPQLAPPCRIHAADL